MNNDGATGNCAYPQERELPIEYPYAYFTKEKALD